MSVRIENRGESIEISPYLPEKWLRLQGSTGLGVAPTIVTLREGASEGATHRRTRRGPRDILMPLTVFGSSATDIEVELRKLARILRDDITDPVLYIVYPSGEERYLTVHYRGGIDPQFGVDSDQRTYAKVPLQLVAPKPYWISNRAQNFSLTVGGSRGLLLNASLATLQVSSSQAIGSMTLVNEGDVEAWPVWELRGPADSFTATSEIGEVMSYTAPITNDNPITIDTRDKTVLDSTLANKYGSLADAPKLFSIPPGESTISIVMTGATELSRVAFYFNPRYELVFA